MLHALRFSCYRRLPRLGDHRWRGMLSQAVDWALTCVAIRCIGSWWKRQSIGGGLACATTRRSLGVVIRGPECTDSRRNGTEIKRPPGASTAG